MIRTLITLILTCVCAIAHAQVGIITTIAGTGYPAYSGDNGPAKDAQFHDPNCVHIDKLNLLYTCDGSNHVVRRIDLMTGIVTTIAGIGHEGYNGDNIPATDAQLFAPEGIVVDSTGNFYISDGLNHRIRRVSTNGIISTVAGTGVAGWNGDNHPATSSQVYTPSGLCIYQQYLYVADFDNIRVRRINLQTGIMTTYVGNGISGYSGDGGPATTACLNGVFDVFCDKNGNLYVSDVWNGAVRKVDVATGIITTVAGNGTLGYSGDNGPATDAQMNEPGGIFVDNNSNLFIADYRNGAIRRVDGTTGIITTVVGGERGFDGDGGPATNAKLKCNDVWVADNGGIYLADYINNRIRRVGMPLKVDDQNMVNTLLLYPNPTIGTFSIESVKGQAIITVCNMAGETVYQVASFTPKTEVDISGQPPGVYMVYVQSGEERYVSKILLQ